jgi:dGTPase
VTSGYDGHAAARWAAEPSKHARNSGRGPFIRDRARVLHSAALRRLAAKTQVVAIGSDDFLRTRLTHSLECAQIGRELGAVLGCDPDLVDAACLAHDLGHPPFGHNGEFALAQLAASCGGFEGNAQSLRLLTRLEAKAPGAGLNLTRATLDATLKYPSLAGQPAGGQPAGGFRRVAPPGQPAGGSRGVAPPGPPGKYGAYAEDAAMFDWIRDGAPPGRACLEAQVMDWADDVAYSVHDLEDGLHTGLIRLDQLRDPAQRQPVTELTLAAYCQPGAVTADELGDVFTRLLDLDIWPRHFDGGPAAAAAVKHLTSELIGRFCGPVEEATRPPGAPPVTRYAADLTVPRQQRLECALLKGVTAYYVMSRVGAAAAQARERKLITELAGAVLAKAPGTLDPMFRAAFDDAAADDARQRVVIDQIASLTDTSAISWHQRLCG